MSEYELLRILNTYKMSRNKRPLLCKPKPIKKKILILIKRLKA